MHWLLRSCCLHLWLLLFAATGALAAPKVVIVHSDSNAAYVTAAQAIVSELERSGVAPADVLQISASAWRTAKPPTPRLYIALGSVAASALARSSLAAPVLCTLLPRSSFERVLLESERKASAQFSAIYLDQPWQRQLALIRLALPAASRIGVLWGPQSQIQAGALQAAAREQGFKLTQASVLQEDLLFPSLKQVLQDADLLLAVVDSQVYNSSNIQNILLTSFRARVPLIAFSPAYVQAGALLAVYATPTQLGLQAGSLASAALRGKALPAAALDSQDFSIAVNEHVARSLGLQLDADALRAQLRRREATP